MAHNWEQCGNERTCFNCFVNQIRIRVVGGYAWRPFASRCTINAKPGRKPRTRDAILAAMDGPTSVKEIMARVGKTRGVVQSALTGAKKAGKVRGVEGERGVWEKIE